MKTILNIYRESKINISLFAVARSPSFWLEMERDLAECIVDVINTEGITCCKFNGSGTILAAGCYDGKAVLFDWSMKGVFRHGIAHNRAVAQVCWNQSQDQVITASSEGIVVVWSVPSFIPVLKYNIGSQLTSINSLSSCPVDNGILLCSSSSIFYLNEGAISRVKLDGDGTNYCGNFLHLCSDFVITDSTGCVYLYKDMIRVHSLKISNSPIAQLERHPELNEFLFSHSDSSIRRFAVSRDDQAIQLQSVKFCNEVERRKWVSFSYLNGGFFVAATCSRTISIWDAIDGRFCMAFEDCPKEGISFMQAVPKSNDFITVSAYGFIYIWSKKMTENWASFAPNFTAIEENVEYVERENEFDIDMETGLPICYTDSTEQDLHNEQINIGTFGQSVNEVNNHFTLDSLSDDEIPSFLEEKDAKYPIIHTINPSQ